MGDTYKVTALMKNKPDGHIQQSRMCSRECTPWKAPKFRGCTPEPGMDGGPRTLGGDLLQCCGPRLASSPAKVSMLDDKNGQVLLGSARAKHRANDKRAMAGMFDEDSDDEMPTGGP